MPIHPVPNELGQGVLSLIQAARIAPSGDNTQPWRFAIQQAGREIFVGLDGTRDRSPMNVGQRMARVAVGAAGENLVAAAVKSGCQVEVVADLQRDAIVVRSDRLPPASAVIPLELKQRVSNRRVFGGQVVEAGQLKQLGEAVFHMPNARVVWLGERGVLESMAMSIGQADATMFGMGAVRRAFLENVRFDRPGSEAVDEGLSLDSLELASAERSGLPMLGKIPDWLFSIGGIARSFRTKSHKLAQSSSGLCVVAATGNERETDFAVGRLMERAWLELTRRSFAVQPMMSLPVLEGMVTHSHPACTKALGQRTAELSGEMKSLVGLADGERIAAVLRFGYAPPPSGRTGRRKLEDVLIQSVEAKG